MSDAKPQKQNAQRMARRLHGDCTRLKRSAGQLLQGLEDENAEELCARHMREAGHLKAQITRRAGSLRKLPTTHPPDVQGLIEHSSRLMQETSEIYARISDQLEGVLGGIRARVARLEKSSTVLSGYKEAMNQPTRSGIRAQT